MRESAILTCPDKFRFFAACLALFILCGGIFWVSADERADREFSSSGETPAIDQYQYSPADTDTVNSAVGTIQVVSIPTGAVVTLDGIYADTTPATFANIPAGDHVIDVVTAGYVPWNKKITVVRGKAIYVDATLKPARNETGSVAITTSPAGANIYIDDVYRGFTPKTIGNLPVGIHTVTLIQAGDIRWDGTILVSPEENTVISQVLMPAITTTTGSISVSSSPVGAAVYLDGDYVGITYTGDMIDINDVVPGTHEVTMRLNGYEDYTTSIDVPASRVVKVNPTLALSRIPHPSGQMQILSTPEGAAVYLDNKFRGYTPLTLQDIEVGQHEIRLKMPGKSDYHDIVRVTAYQTAVVDASMQDEQSLSVPTGVPAILDVFLISVAGIAACCMRRKIP